MKNGRSNEAGASEGKPSRHFDRQMFIFEGLNWGLVELRGHRAGTKPFLIVAWCWSAGVPPIDGPGYDGSRFAIGRSAGVRGACMEQIYYTQCPVGYGLGASNGFQVKRLSRGYPMSGDFRHLGLKAFPGGGRTLAPPTLRYRRDGEVAEVAWLTPRANEYETERGLWGRPGGHFAHGLRLDVEELKAIARWPAGLFESPVWSPDRPRAEPGPAARRGRADPPAACSARRPSPRSPRSPTGEIPSGSARLLTALAKVTREGRTLFLIDEPDRLGPLIALLTFAFPERLRDELTFSTYHDRPEELPGLPDLGDDPAGQAQPAGPDGARGRGRPDARHLRAPDRAGRLGQDPRRLADPARRRSTRPTGRPPRPGPGPPEAAARRRVGLVRRMARPPPRLSRPPSGREVAADRPGRAGRPSPTSRGWLDRSGLAEEWVRPRDPAWWLDAAETAKDRPEARAALVAHADAPRRLARGCSGRRAGARSWRPGSATSIRRSGTGRSPRSSRPSPKSARPSFARALLRGLTPDGGRRGPRSAPGRPDRRPGDAPAAGSERRGGRDPRRGRSRRRSARSWRRPGPGRGRPRRVLDAVEAGLADRPETLPTFADHRLGAFDLGSAGRGARGARLGLASRAARPRPGSARRSGRSWPIRVGRDSGWLSATGRPRTSEPPWPGPSSPSPPTTGLPDEAFRWGVEGLLLPLAPRPSDPTWAETYLKRTPSGLELLRRLVAPEYRKLGVLAWLDQARERGEISTEQAARIDSCLEYAKALTSRDPNSLLKIESAGRPAGRAGQAARPDAQACRRAFAGRLAVRPRRRPPGLARGVRPRFAGPADPGRSAGPLPDPLEAPACPLARPTDPDRRAARCWAGSDRRGFEPDGLAAEVAGGDQPAPGGRPLGAPPVPPAARRRLDDPGRRHPPRPRRRPPRVRPRGPGPLGPPARQGEARAVLRAVPQRLRPPPPRQRRPGEGGRPQDAPGSGLVGPRPATRSRSTTSATAMPEPSPSPRSAKGGYSWSVPGFKVCRSQAKMRGARGSSSAKGLARWRCLEALTNFQNAGREAEVRWPIVVGWEADLPLLALTPDDRYRFLAWVIRGLDAAESYQLSRLATWLKTVGHEGPRPARSLGRRAGWAGRGLRQPQALSNRE